MSERNFTIFCSFLSFVFSLLCSFLLQKYKENKLRTTETYNKLYYNFSILIDKIHQGRAFDFSDLSQLEQSEIIDFLIGARPYANSYLQDRIYTLKCSRHNNFNNNDANCKNEANLAYREITEYIINCEKKQRNKYIKSKI